MPFRLHVRGERSYHSAAQPVHTYEYLLSAGVLYLYDYKQSLYSKYFILVYLDIVAIVLSQPERLTLQIREINRNNR